MDQKWRDIINSLFPLRDESGARWMLLKIGTVILFFLICFNFKSLAGAMRTFWMNIKRWSSKILVWVDCKITDVLCNPCVKACLLIALCVGGASVFYAFVYGYILRPAGMFWKIRVPWIRQLCESHPQLIFWSAFAVYCVICTFACIKWRKARCCSANKPASSPRIAPGHDTPLPVIPETDKNRASFVKVLVEAVACADVRNEAEFIGLYGEWGKGKTTVANSLKNALSTDAMKCMDGDDVCVVNFNPMEFQSSDDALSALFKEIVAQLNATYKMRKNMSYYCLAKAFKAYSTKLYLRRVKLELGTIGEILEIIRQWFYLHFFRVEESKRILSDGLRAASIRLVLIVDDLERLPCKDVSRIMNFLKANLDLPNIVVLILSDRDHLCRSMAAAIGYENANDSEKLEAGKAYLEKFIQRPLEVPEFTRDMIVNYFKEKLPGVLIGVKTLDYEDDFATIADFATTIRQVNKILGRMWATVRYYFHHEGQVYLPYHVGDLASLSALAEFEPSVYHDLPKLIQKLRSDGYEEGLNSVKGISEQFVAQWINENVAKPEHKQCVAAFLDDKISLVKSKNSAGEVICRIDPVAIQSGNYSFRLVAPSWTGMYFRDFSRKVLVRPDTLRIFRESLSSESVPEAMLHGLIESNSLEPFLELLLGQTRFKSEGEIRAFIATLLWLSCQKYGLRYFSDLSGQGFYENTVFMAIYRVWLSYWTREVKMSSAPRKQAIGKIVLEECKSNPACHFIRQLLSSDSINHKKGDYDRRPELFMFSDEHYEELVDLYLDAIEELQSKDAVFDDPCYLDLIRAWNILLIRRDNTERYNNFRALAAESLESVTNILKLRLFYTRSAIYVGDGAVIVDGIYFTGIDLHAVGRLFGLQLLRKIASKLNETYASLSLEDKILSAALTFVSMMDLDPNKCSAELQVEYLKDMFSPDEKQKTERGTEKTIATLRDEFIGAVSGLDFTQQLSALGKAYQVKAVERKDGTIELGHGLYVQTYELIMRGGPGSDDAVYCPLFVYDESRMVLNEVATNEEYLSAALHVSHNYLIPLAKSICGHKDLTYDALEFFVSRNKGIDSGRIGQCAKALYYGAQGDYSSAAQLLIPQIEHLIRDILRANGILGPKTDHRGLGALLYAHGIERVFSKVVLFELRALFMARRNGLNIRNLFAHGELSDYQAGGLEAFYIWWFFVRMVVNLVGEPIDKKLVG